MNSKTGKAAKAPDAKRGWTEDDLRAALPEVPSDANKYTRGRLTVIAGSDVYPGAACLAARAAQRMGAGYTEVVTTALARSVLLVAYPSLVVRDVACWTPETLSGLKLDERRAVCMGPGFVAGDVESEKLVASVLKLAECPVLVDGGALSAIASKKAMKALAKRRELGRATVITPHAGEAARLKSALGLASDDPAHLAAALSMATGAVAVVKGPDTYIANGKRVHSMCEGTPALAKAGTGDVLAGMIASLLAQGVPAFKASVLGATLHARAGSAASEVLTVTCVTPEDVVESIPEAVKTLLR